ncbi:hypothetical protein ACWT_3888 [Actinoplanes sp. SE50]|uniref:YcxB family protein n=1 Tax=unclassified Actinoplanes TaxID=2626549 RepID=UPI00023ED08E|nr:MULTISPECIES: YcxB family protein [unclassified Actinoplanes]AEV84912.1 hypothetical protein ACPL_4017 [Actinoplanes sp. SE50/110]ATO83303.1 hypothetical protein ACWT_3888 [Actinoplanes sp. SE50]SLM00710.1 hypothetical protein ACSP50_3943 [Actinoplanes sp. SE50/110]
MPSTFTFTPTRADLRWVIAQRLRPTVRALAAFGFAVGGAGVFALASHAVLAGLALLYFGLLFVVTAARMVSATLNRMPAFTMLPQTYRLDDEGITVSSRASVVWYAWDAFDRVVTAPGGWLLFAGRLNTVTIVRRMVPDGQVAELERELSRVGRLPEETPAADDAPVAPAAPARPGGVRPAVPDEAGPTG